MAWRMPGKRRPHAVPSQSVGGSFPTPHGPAGLTAGWKAFPSAPPDQIGAFNGQMLNQFPANIPGVQLHSGREWGNSGWYYPSRTALPNGSVTQTTKPNNLPGGQREGSIYSGPIGPLSARQNAVQLAAAQVRQSGLQAMQWAQSL